MKKELDALISFLNQRGYIKQANEVEKSQSSFKVKVDPLTFAVSQGLLNPQVLDILDEEGHEEDLAAFKNLIRELKEENEIEYLET